MLDTIVTLLNLDDFYGVSENIDIAKGKNKMPSNFREGWKQHVRNKKAKR